MSFFPLKDSFGTVQLIVNNSEQTREDLAALSKVPTESSVLVQGQVLLRPPSARRPVSPVVKHDPRILLTSDVPRGQQERLM